MKIKVALFSFIISAGLASLTLSACLEKESDTAEESEELEVEGSEEPAEETDE